jgi:hypothetical protein
MNRLSVWVWEWACVESCHGRDPRVGREQEQDAFSDRRDWPLVWVVGVTGDMASLWVDLHRRQPMSYPMADATTRGLLAH